jgi:hypothetical protein
MSGNETVLHLPSGDFEILREEHLDDPAKRPRLLRLMLEEGNFGRAFPYWQKIAPALGITNIRNDAHCRSLLSGTLRH